MKLDFLRRTQTQPAPQAKARAAGLVVAWHNAGRMIAEAEMADLFRARTGQAHPLFGNGSLMVAARKRPLAAEPGFDDAEYCRCFEQVLRALVER